MKKLLLSLGTIATVAVPVAAVVSCGSDSGTSLPDMKKQMIAQVNKMGLTDTQAEAAITKINAAKDVDEVLIEFADASRDATKDADFVATKANTKSMVPSLKLSDEQNKKVYAEIEAATNWKTLADVVMQATQLSNQLSSSKILISAFIQKLNLTPEQLKTITDNIDKASTPNSVMREYESAESLSDTNNKAAGEATQANYDSGAKTLNLKINLDQEGELSMPEIKQLMRLTIEEYSRTSTDFDLKTSVVNSFVVTFKYSKDATDTVKVYPIQYTGSNLSSALESSLYDIVNYFAQQPGHEFASYAKMNADVLTKLKAFTTKITTIAEANKLLGLYDDSGFTIVASETNADKYQIETKWLLKNTAEYDTPLEALQHIKDTGGFGATGTPKLAEITRILGIK